MSRVLVTGGVGLIGTAVVRRLLGDPAYEVRVADQHPASHWMREGCEVHTGDLRLPERARAATAGCTHVVHLAAIKDVPGEGRPQQLIEANNALLGATIDAALEAQVERFTYISCAEVFERASLFPTPEDHLTACPAPTSAYAFSKLAGEVHCRAAHAEHGLPFTICRAADAYGPDLPSAQFSPVADAPLLTPSSGGIVGDMIAQALAGRHSIQVHGPGGQTRTPTHVQDIAAGILTAMSLPGGLNEDFNIVASQELTLAELARLVWDACERDPKAFALEELPVAAGPLDGEEVLRRWPSSQKARELLSWEPQVEAAEGIATIVRGLRDPGSVGSRA